MKNSKIFACILSACLVCLTAASCGELDTSSPNSGPSSTASQTEKTNEPAETNPDKSNQEGEGDIGDYHIKIVSSEKGKDYSGNDVLIVTYEWTNNSDEEQMFSTAFAAKAFQNGIECGDAIMVDGVDSQKLLANIKPGATLEVKDAYKLDGDSDVEIEVKPWISLEDNPPMVKKTFSVK